MMGILIFFYLFDGSIGSLVPNLAKSKNINLDEVVIEVSASHTKVLQFHIFFQFMAWNAMPVRTKTATKINVSKQQSNVTRAWTPA